MPLSANLCSTRPSPSQTCAVYCACLATCLLTLVNDLINSILHARNHMTILSSLFCMARRVSEPKRLLRVLLCDFYRFQHNTKALQNGEMGVFVPPISKLTCMHQRSTLVHVCPLWTLSCSRFWTFKMPKLSSGVDYSPVVNNSRIEWTKLHQLEDACYLVVGTNKYWFDCFSVSPQRCILQFFNPSH